MGDATGGPEGNRDALIGKLALELQWITPLQLREALTEQWAESESGKGRTRSLGTILVARGILTGSQLDQLYDRIQTTLPSFPPFGKYNLLREIGRGAFGVVYEAEDRDLKRRVALKMLAPGSGAAGEDARFDFEGRQQRTLPPHPGIVPVLEAGVIDGRRYLAVELVDGVSMDVWHKHGSITVRQRVALIRDVALALHHAHQHGLVHRSLKPENILVDRHHQPKVTDFGVAGGGTQKPFYLSPEQVTRAGGIDHRTDIYSLGVMLYEVLTNRRPFDGQTPEEIMTKTAKQPVLPPSMITDLNLNAAIYKNLEGICLLSLAKKPEDRYADAAVLARDLTRWLKGEDFRITLPSSWRLSRAAVLGIAGLVLAAALGGAFLLRPRGSKETPVKTAVAPPPPPPPPPAPVAVPVPALASGSIAEYYAGMNFNALGLRRIDNRSSFDDPALPLWPEGPGTYTSHRWSGVLRIPVAGTYVFDVKSKDPARLVIGDIERYRGQRPATLSIPFEAGEHRFLLEHSHAGANDTVSISWQKPGQTASTKLGPGALHYAPREFAPVEPQPAHRRTLGPVAGAEEGELLEVLEDSGHKPSRKAYGPFAAFWKGSWSGSHHLFWNAGPGDRLKVRFAAGETGLGTLALGLTRATDHGIFRISVNGVVIADTIDQFAEGLITQEVEFKEVRLKSGSNELQFEVVGSNPNAREWAPGNGLYKFGLDYVLVR